MKSKLPNSKPLLFVFGLLIGVFTILYSAYQLDLMDMGFGPTREPEIVYGPVVSDLSGGMYSVLWVTDEPVLSKVDYGSGEVKMDSETSYHYYRIDSAKINGTEVELYNTDKSFESISVKPVEIDPQEAPDMPFVGFGEVKGLSQNEGFVVIEAGDKTYLSVVKDNRWSIDFPSEIKELTQGTLHVVKEDVLFSTIINFKYIQPTQTIVLDKTYDRIKPQTSDRSIDGLVNDAYACEGDVGSWEITCPDGTTQTESDACTQDRFMSTHDNGYDQWAYEACGCPMEGETWTAECVDGTTFEEADMCSHDLFYRVHSDQGYAQWQTEACQDHGGPLELQYEQEGAWNRTPFEKTPPNVANQQPASESLPPFLCCWGESGASYAVPTDEVDNPQCLPQDNQIGTAQTSDGCESLFNQPIEEIRKMIEEQEQQPAPETPPAQNSYDPALANNDLKNYNPNYPSKEDSLAAYCTSAFPDSVNHWSQLITYWSQSLGVDPNAAAAIMAVESCGSPGVRSSAGAQSLFQVMPFHFKTGEDPYDPDTNAKVGIRYYKSQLDSFGDEGLAFAAYNGGPYGPVAGGYANQSNWSSETQRYHTYTTGLMEDAKSCNGTKSSGSEQFWSARGSGCQSALSQLESGPTFEGTSDIANACFQPDTRGRCANANCDDQIGQSCSTDPDSCVYGGICIGGTCQVHEPSGCPDPNHNNETASTGSQNANASTSSNETPVKVNRSSKAASNTGGDYSVIEYNVRTGLGTNAKPSEYAVLHWTAGGTADNVVNYFKGICPRGSCLVANYVVDTDGSNHLVYPPGEVTYNAANEYINKSSISFENIGTGGTGWSNLTSDQAHSNVQEIIRHIENGNFVSADKLKVIGHFQANGTSHIDPQPDYVAQVCSELHQLGYKVLCNFGVDSSYNIPNDRNLKAESPISNERGRYFSLVQRSHAQVEGYEGPGMYKVEIDGYETETLNIYLVKDLESTTFYEDANGSGKYESGEEVDLYDSILSVEKLSNDVAIDMDDYVNMVSFPVLPEGVSTADDLNQYLNQKGADVVSISRMHNNNWQTYQVRDGKAFSEDFELAPNETYFIKLNYKTTVIVGVDEVLDVDNTLDRGWNTVVMPEVTSNPTVAEISEYFEGGESIDAVFYWDGAKYVGATLEDDEVYGKEFTLIQNRPYWVRVSQ